MSLSIYFCAEVQRNGKWYPLIWNHKPIEGESYCDEEEPTSDMAMHYRLYDDNAYDYDALWRDVRCDDGLPDDMSPELRTWLENKNNMGFGYFMLSDLVKYVNELEEEMVKDLQSSRDFQVVKHLNRIEKAVLKKPIKDPIDTEEMCPMSIKWIYEHYVEETFCMNRLIEIVLFLANSFCRYPNPKTSEIRISFYQY